MMFHHSRAISVAFGAAVVLLSACGDPEKSTEMQMSMNANTPLTRTDWDSVRSRTIYFGHQSVGDNILDGLSQIAETEKWPSLKVVEGVPPVIAEPAILHTKVGQNGNPSSKITGFKQALEMGAGSRADIALMKFCYWDVRADTDIDKVFAEYQKTMADIGRQFPKLTLLHATVPLTAQDRDWRARVRRLFGQSTATDADNSRRLALNQKIRAAYGNRLFDIARAEQDSSDNSPVPSLSEALSSDGGHLNQLGRQQVASVFVRSVAAATLR
jgi:hypothetical protein